MGFEIIFLQKGLGFKFQFFGKQKVLEPKLCFLGFCNNSKIYSKEVKMAKIRVANVVTSFDQTAWNQDYNFDISFEALQPLNSGNPLPSTMRPAKPFSQ
jgi:hypothetical protein